jgi:hypothetical protein
MTYRAPQPRGNASDLKGNGFSAMRYAGAWSLRGDEAGYAARMRGRSSRSIDGISLSGFGRLNR